VKDRVIARAKRQALRAAFPRRERGLRRVGSAYGGWYVPDIDPAWVCCTAGVGEDASFDVALAECGCDVLAVDPTPRAISYIEPLLRRHPTLRLAPYAVWPEAADLSFFPPVDPANVSFSATNLQRTANPITVPARRLEDILHEFGYDRAHLVKLDIEGAEYRVLPTLNLAKLDVRILCVEYHFDQHGLSGVIQSIRSVEKRGFRVAHVDHTNVTFCRT
jgi:FkbM family methyltransferase